MGNTRDSALDAVIAILLGIIVGHFTSSQIGIATAAATLGLLVAFRYRDMWSLAVKSMVVGGALVLAVVIAVFPNSPTPPVHLRLLSWNISHKRAQLGTVLEAKMGFINVGGPGLVKRVGGFSVGPNNLERAQHVDIATRTRLATLPPAALDAAPYYQMEEAEGSTVTIRSLPLDQEFYLEYQHGIVFFYVDYKVYQKSLFGYRLVQDVCLYSTGSSPNYDSCPER